MFLTVFWTMDGEGRLSPRIEAHLGEEDRRLLEGLARRDEDALRELLRGNRDRIYNLALRITGSPEDAEEVTQDTFLRLLDKIGQFEGRSSLGTWVYRMGLNLALMKRRSKGRRREQAWEDPLAAYDENGMRSHKARRWSGSVADIEREQADRLVREAVAELPDDYRDVVVLADLEGRSRQEIAEMLELTVAAVKSRLHRARLMLRDRLDGEFGES